MHGDPEMENRGSDATGKSPQVERRRELAFKCPILVGTLFISNLDPFELYKNPAMALQNHSEIDLSSYMTRFSMEFTPTDRLRMNFAQYHEFLGAFIFLKGLIMGAIQFFILQHELYRTALGRYNKRPVATRQPSEPLIREDLLRYVSGLMGNPLAILNDLSLYLYMGMTGLVFVRIVIIPRYHREWKPLDMSYLRFLFRPRLEQHRLDVLARQKISDIENSVKNHTSNRIDQLCHNASLTSRWTNSQKKIAPSECPIPSHSAFGSFDRLKLIENGAQVRRMVRAIGSDQHELVELRPHIFHLEWHALVSKWMNYIMNVIMIEFSLWTLINICIAFRPSLIEKECGPQAEWRTFNFTTKTETGPGNNLEPWRPVKCDTFTWRDWLFTGELLYCAAICICCECCDVALSVLCLANQTKLISSMISELATCEEYLRKYSNILQLSAVFRERLAARRDELLLKQLVKLATFESELAYGFSALTEQALTFGYHIFMLAFLLAITSNMQIALASHGRTLILLLTWIWFNTVAFFCCMVHSHCIKLGKWHWSILAQMTIIQAQEARLISFQNDLQAAESKTLNRLDIVKEVWQKFTIVTSNSLERYCVRPYGVRLNYSQVIEINFLFVFIYSLRVGQSTRGHHW